MLLMHLVIALTGTALGAEPVVSLAPLGPYGKPLPPLFPGEIHSVRVTYNPNLDGVFDEPAWQVAKPVPGPRAIGMEPPPFPSWQVRVWVAPAGLVVGIQNVPPDAAGGISIDPDRSRRGWALVEFGPDKLSYTSCRFGHEDSVMPFPEQWSVYLPRCSAPVPAAGARGVLGWEILLPWSSLTPATDDLHLHAWARSPGYSASWDPDGGAAGYGQGRPIVVDGRKERGDDLAVRYRRGDGLIELVLTSPGLTGPEPWVVEVWRAGALLQQHHLLQTPAPNGVGTSKVQVREPEWAGLNFLARREGVEPLGPAARAYPWLVAHGANVATPVVTDRLEFRFNLSFPENVVLEVATSRGAVLTQHPVSLPPGVGIVRLDRDPTWPRDLQVRLGDLLPGGWQPIVASNP
jgi:hypothetical protein